jgi:hypothetical protein
MQAKVRHSDVSTKMLTADRAGSSSSQDTYIAFACASQTERSLYHD